VFGWLKEFIEIKKHNVAIDKKWREDGCPIVSTTVGWRLDPWNKQDGYRKDPPNGQEYSGDGNSYSKLIRGGTKEYREKFAGDVEEAKKRKAD